MMLVAVVAAYRNSDFTWKVFMENYKVRSMHVPRTGQPHHGTLVCARRCLVVCRHPSLALRCPLLHCWHSESSA